MRDVAKAGGVIDAVAAATGDDLRLNGVSFSIADTTALAAKAREDAVAQAKTQAAALAQAAGVELGPIVAVSTAAYGLPQPVAYATSGAAADRAAPMPLQPGTQAVTAHVERRVRAPRRLTGCCPGDPPKLHLERGWRPVAVQLRATTPDLSLGGPAMTGLPLTVVTDTPCRPSSKTSSSARSRRYHAGSERSVERQHAKGKMLARERIEYLLDPGSFHELDMLARHRAHAAGLEERPYTDGVITGWGTIDGRKVFVFCQDFTVFGGALGEVFAEKIHKLMDLALKVGRAGHRPQRRRRRPHPGGRRLASPATAASSTATCSRRASCRRSA